jgi:hypothetical protein
MTVLQKWIAGIIALGAGYLVFAKPESFYKAAQGVRGLVAGSVVDVTTGGQGSKTMP